jgi:formylglycine-generating enzyme required for sulfatase activity
MSVFGSKLVVFLVLAAFSDALFSQTQTPTRRALLIGNANYRNLKPLATPHADLAELSGALRKLGFSVLEARDTELKALMTVFEQDFLPTVNKGDVVLVYFSGYGIQARNDGYLLPVEFKPEAAASEVSVPAYSIARILFKLDEREPQLKILVAETAWEEPQLLQKGFLGMSPPNEMPSATLLAMAAAPGVVGTVVSARHAPFTSALSQAISKPGASLNDIFAEAKQRVAQDSKQQQEPFWMATGLPTFYFIPPAPKVEVKEVVKEVPVVQVVESTNPFRPNLPLMNKTDRQEYLLIPAGRFKMGCVPASLDSCGKEEHPQHPVEVSKAFWMGRTEVEVKAYRRFVDAKGRKMPAASMVNAKWQRLSDPIVKVEWRDAQDYCQWAAEGGRLPTEAEWEYAARGGKEDEVLPMKDMETARDKANFYGKAGNDTFEFTAPVKSFDPNGYGLYDMAGNVWEWVLDYFEPDYYSKSPATDPAGPATGKGHVVRGGSYQSDPVKHLRISVRELAESESNKIGFRCVLPDNETVRSGLMR